MLRKLLKTSFIVCLCFSISGCSAALGIFSGKATPRAWRGQIFSNNPTGYNQNDFATDEEAELTTAQIARQLRNGTRSVHQKYRMIGVRNNNDMEDGSTEDSYGAGYATGCHTSMSVLGSGLYRFNNPEIDAERMSHDQMYLRGFSDGMSFCKDRSDWELH